MAAITVLAIFLIRSLRTYSAADMCKAFAEDARQKAQRDFGVTLDFSPASVERLEGILARQVEEMKDSPLLPIQIEAIAKVWGAYLGEVIRRQRGGDWISPKTGPFAGLCVLRMGTEEICPLAKVYKRLSDGAEDNLFAYSQVLLERSAFSKPSRDQKDPASSTSPLA